MTLEARLISNSNAFFARQDKSPLVADEYEKQFKIAFNDNKKVVTDCHRERLGINSKILYQPRRVYHMEEFEDSQLRDLQEVEGIVLRDVHGERVAIGKGFPYENIFSFMVHYFNFYTVDDFAEKLGYKDGDEMFKYWFSQKTELTEFNLVNWCMDSFKGIYAEDLADLYGQGWNHVYLK
jgi:hypothetical protein